MPERTHTTAIVLYLHLPWVMDDSDVEDMVRESLSPLLAAHARANAPLTLAVTGAFLNRLIDVSPSTLELMQRLVNAGTVEIAATFFHEVYPPFLKPRYLRAQLGRDIALKRSLFGVVPTCFYPANFAWSPCLPHMLREYGVGRVILDHKHLDLVGAMQDWKWNALGQSDTLVPAALPKSVIHRMWVLHDEDAPILDLFFVDRRRVEAFSFGDSGLIHRPLSDRCPSDGASILAGPLGVSVIADDADRVNALSVLAYEQEIARARRWLTTLGAIRVEAVGRIDYLPGFSLGDLFGFWLSGPDSFHWLHVLEEVEEALDGEVTDQLLALQDVYPLFWRTHWRCGRFWRLAVELTAKTIREREGGLSGRPSAPTQTSSPRNLRR